MSELFDDILRRLGSKRTLVLIHHNADTDAVGSALAFKFVFKDIDIGCPESVSLTGKRLATALGVEIQVDPDTKGYEQFLVLDTSSPVQLGGLAEGLKEIIHIDHHHTTPGLWNAALQHIDADASSCCEIVYEILSGSGKTLGHEVGVALLAGILSDTARFRFATPRTLRTVVDILERTGVSIEEVMVLLEDEDYFNYSKRTAQLKAASRVKMDHVGETIIASSNVGSFEAAAARALLICGGDIVFVYNDKGTELRVSARAKPHMVKMGLNLGVFMSEVAGKMGCQGGGHPGAAGLNGKARPEEAMKVINKELKRKLKDLGLKDGPAVGGIEKDDKEE